MAVTKAPILYSHDMVEKARLYPSSMSLSFNLRSLDTAEMVLPEGQMNIDGTRGLSLEFVQLHDFVRVDKPGGGIGLYRVTNVDHTFRGEARVNLNHAVDVLNDVCWRDYSKNWYGKAEALIDRLLTYQRPDSPLLWQKGTVADTEYWSKDGIDVTMTIYDLLSEMRDTYILHRADYAIAGDGAGTPYYGVINFLKLSNDIQAEFRLSRNIEKCSYTRDDSDLINRMQLRWKATQDTWTNFTQYDDVNSQAKYGIVEKGVLGDDTAISNPHAPDQRRRWAEDFLAKHSKPKLTVKIDGYQFKRLTGLDWDEAAVGKLVRVSLPEYGEIYEERCANVTYPDVIRTPDRVTIELGDHQDRLSEINAATLKRQGSDLYFHIDGEIVPEDEEEDDE